MKFFTLAEVEKTLPMEQGEYVKPSDEHANFATTAMRLVGKLEDLELAAVRNTFFGWNSDNVQAALLIAANAFGYSQLQFNKAFNSAEEADKQYSMTFNGIEVELSGTVVASGVVHVYQECLRHLQVVAMILDAAERGYDLGGIKDQVVDLIESGMDPMEAVTSVDREEHRIDGSETLTSGATVH